MENNENKVVEEKEETKKSGSGKILYLVLLLVIFAVCYVLGYGIGSKLGNDKDKEDEKVEEKADDKENNEDDVNVENNEVQNEVEEAVSFEDFNYEEVTSIILEVPCADCGDPVMNEVVLTDREEIKYILSNLDKAEFVAEWPAETGVGSVGAMTIEVVYSEGQDPATSVVFLNTEGGVAINYSVGVAETNWAEYKIANVNFKQELLDKYQK